MTQLMDALVVTAPNRAAIERIKVPDVGPDHVLIRVHGCTICGSDLKLLRGEMDGVSFPLVPGHEWSGEVVDARGTWKFLIGQRVVADMLQTCNRCQACMRQERNLCQHLIEPGLTALGAYADYICVPGTTVLPLPPSLDLDTACLVEPLSVALYALDRQPARAGECVLVLGGGGIGLLLVACLRACGIEDVFLVDPHENRRRLATNLGAKATAATCDAVAIADQLGRPPDVVYNAASRVGAFLDAIAVCRPGGRICTLGYTGADSVSLRPSDLVVKLLDIRGSLSPTYDWNAAANALAASRIRVDGLITHRVGLRQFAEAFSLAADRRDGAVRVMVRP